jgi:hypothetical protein
MALGALVFVLGTVDLFVSLRRLPQAVRKSVKPTLLLINACRYQESEHEVSRLEVLRQDAVRLIREQRAHQVRLQEQRNRIAGW